MSINKNRFNYTGWVIGCFLITHSTVFGQYLNEVVETPGIYEYSYNWNLEGNNLTGIHTYQDSNWLLSGWSGLEFKQYDQNLNPINTTKYFDPNYNYWSGWSVAFDGENYYYVGGKRGVTSTDTTRAYLIKFSAQGDVLWEKNFFIDSKFSWGLYCLYKNDSLYISGHYRYPVTDALQAFVFSADTSGQVGWSQNFTGGAQSNVSFSKTEDNGFLLTVYKQLGFYDPTVVYKLDSLGNIEWERQLTYPTEQHILSAVEMPDGNFLCYGHSEDAQTTRKRSWLVKLSATGDLLIDTLFNFSAGYDIFGNPNNVLFFDNQIQLTGAIYDDEFSNVAKLHIVRYDFNLNLLWRRVYYHREYQNEVTYQHDMDNGFTLFAGHVSQDPTHPTRDEWFLVLDSLGCDTPNCALGLEALEADQFLIYPNPASTTLNVDFKSYEGQEITVQLVSMEGQLLESYQLLSNLNSIDVRHLSSGIYFVRISREGQVLASEKLLIH